MNIMVSPRALVKDFPTVCPATPLDLPLITELYHRVWHETHGPHMPRAECDTRDESFFLNRLERLTPDIVVGKKSDAIIGFAAWRGPILGQLFLEVAARGSGLAQILLEAAERGMGDQGTFEAELHCLLGNERAKRFYERAGWHVSEIIAEAVKGDSGSEQRDFWVMRKLIAPTAKSSIIRSS